MNKSLLTPILTRDGAVLFLSNDDPALNNPMTIKLKWSDIVTQIK
jgi:hypothetical protein